jgi:putative ABC transport system substrate-binding protein
MLLAGLGGALGIAGTRGWTQSAPRRPTIVFLANSDASGYREAFEAGLRDRGWIPGQNVGFVHRTRSRSAEEMLAQASALMRLSPDVIVAGSNAQVAAFRKLTTTVPIVVAAARDPVGAGFTTSLARPSSNVTGLNGVVGTSIGSKRLELLKEIAPGVTRIAILREAQASSPALLDDLRTSARALGLDTEVVELDTLDDVDRALANVLARRCDAIVLEGAGNVVRSAPRVAEFAIRHRMPSLYAVRETTEAGLLFSYGLNLLENYRYTAHFVDRILRGARPADLPIEQPVKFELVINAKTAKAIGLAIPKSVLLRADEVIE